jgi:hypothetical protein
VASLSRERDGNRRESTLNRRGAVFAVLVLSACGAPPPKPPAGAGPAGSPPAVDGTRAEATRAPPPGARYRIDPAASELRVLVYRAGAMASLGHNHVISTHTLTGWAAFDGSTAAAAFEVTVPVAGFAIDDPALRAEEGADFAEEVSDEARSGTLHNMLGPDVLDCGNFATLEISSLSIAPAGSGLQAQVSIQVAGHRSIRLVPFTLEVAPHRLVARGELNVSQSSLGLTPFSIFLGALKVQDEMRVKFKFVEVEAGS